MGHLFGTGSEIRVVTTRWNGNIVTKVDGDLDQRVAIVPTVNPIVFFTYAHDSVEHLTIVREFAALLSSAGIQPILDQWQSSARRDWYSWGLQLMAMADFVVVIASPGFRRVGDGHGPNDRNLGLQAEAAFLREQLQRDRRRWTAKILPVVLPGRSIDEIPDFLQSHTCDHYVIDSLTLAGAEDLLRTITGQPAHVAPPVGPVIELPPRSGPYRPTWTPLPDPPVVSWRYQLNPELCVSGQSTLELHLVPPMPGQSVGIQALAQVRPELVDIGRKHGIFPAEYGLATDYSGEGAWCYLKADRERAAGLAIYRNGQRGCWATLSRTRKGWLFDPDLVVEELTQRLTALLDFPLALPLAVGVALAIEPVKMVLDQKGATPRQIGRRGWIRIEPDDAVSVGELGRMTRQVAADLVRRLIARLT